MAHNYPRGWSTNNTLWILVTFTESLDFNIVSDDAKNFIETIHVTYNDKLLGAVRRNYVIQIPKGLDNNSPVPMVLDLHGWTGSAQSQTHQSGWKQLGNTEKFVVIWPDGMDDSPSKMGSWNCSMSTGKTIQENKCLFKKFHEFLTTNFLSCFSRGF